MNNTENTKKTDYTQPPKEFGATPKIGLVSLGCPKALVDSERIMTKLRSDGYQFTDTHEGADLVIVNTCGFLDSAKAESLQAIGDALDDNFRSMAADEIERFRRILRARGRYFPGNERGCNVPRKAPRYPRYSAHGAGQKTPGSRRLPAR